MGKGKNGNGNDDPGDKDSDKELDDFARELGADSAKDVGDEFDKD